MNKIAIPAILVATVMVAGMFAFVPVEQASTVHTSLSQTITLTEEETDDTNDFILTCEAATTCQILDVYLIEEDGDGGDDIDLGNINMVMAEGETLELAVDGDNLILDNDVAAVNNVSGVTMPAGAVITFGIDADGSDDFTLVVVITTDGTGTATLTSP